jgi:glyoxylase-like metal-dependent hydrolase (beta-lactamase superfamily II)
MYFAVGLVLTAQFFLVSETGAQTRRLEGDLETVHVRDNIYMLVMEPAGNIAVSIGEDGVILIDDQFRPMTDRIVDAVRKLSDQPIRYVFNTHWHGDHTGANRNFGSRESGKPGSIIVAHENVRKRLSEEQFHLVFRARSAASPPEALPVITFSESMTFYFNDDVIDVLHVPLAHTDGDSIFYFRNADVMHTGDAYINSGYPLIDIASNGSVEGQIEATNRMIELVGPDTIVISGHGPLSGKQRLVEVRDMLVEVRTRVRRLIAEGLTLKEIKARKPLADLDPVWGQRLIKGNLFVTIVYQSETGDWTKPENMPLAE